MKLTDIISKDMRVVLRDRVALMFIFLMPIVLITILSFALGGVFSSDGLSIGQINIAVVDKTAEDEMQQAAEQMAGYGAFLDMQQMSLYTVFDSKEVSGFLSYNFV